MVQRLNYWLKKTSILITHKSDFSMTEKFDRQMSPRTQDIPQQTTVNLLGLDR